ncbi:MAG: hypothetical protein NDF55_10245 [archaeon GB-1867-005]|nr:hypothetical protein [Candidatus Culexmicrobium cathedralense]
MWTTSGSRLAGSWLPQFSIDVVLEEASKLEEKGRELASKPESAKYSEVSSWCIDVYRSLDRFEDAAPLVGDGRVERFIRELKEAVFNVDIASRECYTELVPSFKQCSSNVTDRLKRAATYLRGVDKVAEQIWGRRCTWLRGVVEPYTLTAAINDCTACYHRLIEYFREKIGPLRKVSEKCLALGRASERAVEFCKLWDKYSKMFDEKGLYWPEDAPELRGVAVNSRVELKVGSAKGHRTHVDLEKGKLQYFDNDRPVNDIVESLLEKQGLKCRRMYEEGLETGIECEGPIWERRDKVAKTIALATSMDLRMSSDEEQEEAWHDLMDKVGECFQKYVDNHAIEECACQKIIEEN